MIEATYRWSRDPPRGTSSPCEPINTEDPKNRLPMTGCPLESLVGSDAAPSGPLVFGYDSDHNERAALVSDELRFVRTYVTEDVDTDSSSAGEEGSNDNVLSPRHLTKAGPSTLRGVMEGLLIDTISNTVTNTTDASDAAIRASFNAFLATQEEFIVTYTGDLTEYFSIISKVSSPSSSYENHMSFLTTITNAQNELLQGLKTIAADATYGGLLTNVDTPHRHDTAVLMSSFRNYLNIFGQEKSFASIDTNHSGSIEVQEFHDFAARTLSMSTSESTALFQVLDLNGSNSITFSEFVAPHIPTLRAAFRNALFGSFDSIPDAFRHIDTDGSGGIQREEFVHFATRCLSVMPRDADALFTYLDLNDDGSITFSEITKCVDDGESVQGCMFVAVLDEMVPAIQTAYMAYIQQLDNILLFCYNATRQTFTQHQQDVVREKIFRTPLRRVIACRVWFQNIQKVLCGDAERAVRRSAASLYSILAAARTRASASDQQRELELIAARLIVRDRLQPRFELMLPGRAILKCDKVGRHRKGGLIQPSVLYLLTDCMLYHLTAGTLCRAVLSLECLQAFAVPSSEVVGMENAWLVRTPTRSVMFVSPCAEARDKWLCDISHARSVLGLADMTTSWHLPRPPGPAELCALCAVPLGLLRRCKACKTCREMVCQRCSRGAVCYACILDPPDVEKSVRSSRQRGRGFIRSAPTELEVPAATTPEEKLHPEEELVVAPLEPSNNFAETLQERIRIKAGLDIANKKIMTLLQAKFAKDVILDGDRFFIHQGVVLRRHQKAKKFTTEQMFLFSDSVMFATMGHNLTETVSLHHMRVGPMSENAFLFMSPTVSSLLQSDSASLWVHRITAAQAANPPPPTIFFDMIGVPNDTSSSCDKCSVVFSMWQRKRCCVRCGKALCDRCSGGKARGATSHLGVVCMVCLGALRTTSHERFIGCFPGVPNSKSLGVICVLCRKATYGARCSVCLGDMCSPCCSNKVRVPKLDPLHDVLVCKYCVAHCTF